MKVILLSDVKSLGKKGDIVEVSAGYAKNMLFKKKLGVEANAKTLNDLKLKNQYEDKLAAQRLAEAQALADRLGDVLAEVKIKTGENGKTFGSVSTKEISEALKSQFDLDIDKKKMVLAEPIRALGTYEVPVKLHPQVTGTLRVHVGEQ